jgi:hypothetical protein
MNPSNKIMGDTKNEEKDLNVHIWLDDAVSSLRPALLPLLKDAIFVHLESHYGWKISSSYCPPNFYYFIAENVSIYCCAHSYYSKNNNSKFETGEAIFHFQIY